MQTTDINAQKNAEHYDERYRSVNVECVVRTIRNLPQFLDDAIRTDTSWHGFYHQNFAQQIAGKKVLELGCGDGLNALIMASLGADVVANDISTESARIISEAAAILGLNNIRTACGDFAELSFEPHSFDYVVGKAFLHHLTHEQEAMYFKKIASILKPDGEARFFEPAVNSPLLDTLRWIVPLPGRPSLLSRKAFAAWKAEDPHPDRDNSSAHYLQIGKELFGEFLIEPIGSIERLCRLMPRCDFQRVYRRWAHRMEIRLPRSFRNWAARSQLIVYRHPHMEAGAR